MSQTRDLPEYSISMSVYSGEKPRFLRRSMESMFSQTYPCKEFILVCDGELGYRLDEIVESFKLRFPDKLKIIKMPKKCGVGACANEALKAASCEYIVKMDSDDVAMLDRCEKQLGFMASHPEIDICGAYIEEFDSDSGDVISVRKTPKGNAQIREYAKRRSPFNNQTIVYKKSAALKVGGYSTVTRCEDYDFVVRMLDSGAKGANIPEPLVKYRVTPENLKRRRNFANTKSFISVRWRIFRSGYSSLDDFLIPCAAQIALFILPDCLTGKLYKKFLRK